MNNTFEAEWYNHNGDEVYFFIGIDLVIDDIEMCLCLLHAVRLKKKSKLAVTLNELAISDLDAAYAELYRLLVLEDRAVPCSTPPDLRAAEQYVQYDLSDIDAYDYLPDSLVAHYHRFRMVEAGTYLIELGASALSESRLDLLDPVLRACQLICTVLSRIEVFCGIPAADQSFTVVRPPWHPQIQLTVNRLHTSKTEVVQRDLEACINLIDPPSDGSEGWRYEDRAHFQLSPPRFSQAHH